MANWFGDVLKNAAGSLVGGLPGALLGMGTSVIGSLVSNSMNRSNQALTQEWQEKMNLQQQEWQEGMWNKTNEYNNASNQMQRLMDAGINPNAAAAQIAGTNGSAQLAQQPQIPSGNPIPGVNMDLVGGAMQGMSANKEMQLMDAQRENIEADTEQKLVAAGVGREDILLKKAQTGNINLSTWLDYWYGPSEREKGIEFLDAQIDKIFDERYGIQLDNFYKKFNNDVLLPLIQQKEISTIKNIDANTRKAIGELKLTLEQVKTEKKKQDLLEAQTEGQNKVNYNQDLENGIKEIVKKQYGALGTSLSESGLDQITKIYVQNAINSDEVSVEQLIQSVQDAMVDQYNYNQTRNTSIPGMLYNAGGAAGRAIRGRRNVRGYDYGDYRYGPSVDWN